jgi:hypothetical protein
MNDEDNIILGAITLGFDEYEPNKFKCTKEQLLTFVSLISSSIISQLGNTEND